MTESCVSCNAETSKSVINANIPLASQETSMAEHSIYSSAIAKPEKNNPSLGTISQRIPNMHSKVQQNCK